MWPSINQSVNELAEWDTAETGRHTYSFLPSVDERQLLIHLQDLDHEVIQLLTGHGPYKQYLMRFHRSDTDACENCGEIDDPFHSILFRPTHLDIKAALHDKAIEFGDLLWNIATMLHTGLPWAPLSSRQA